MLLTSLDRMTRYLAGNNSENLVKNSYNKRDILMFANSVSNRIQHHINTEIELGEYVEYKQVNRLQSEFRANHFPVLSISSVKLDSTGLFNGNEYELQDNEYYINPELQTISLTSRLNFNSSRGVQIVYRGGMCTHATQSIFNVSTISGFSKDNFVVGLGSGAVGVIKLVDVINTRLTVEVLYGEFIAVESIEEYVDENMDTPTGSSTTILSKNSIALCETKYSGIVTACEIETRYIYKHKLDFENSTTDKDSVTQRRSEYVNSTLQPEVVNMLTQYRRYS